jgi:Transposase, Mutator family
MSDHLGYGKHDPAGRNGGNSRNGTRTKTVATEIGPVEIEVPRDRDGSFEPAIVPKRQRRLDGIDEIVLSLTAPGLTTGEVAAHFAEVYGTKGAASEPTAGTRHHSQTTISSLMFQGIAAIAGPVSTGCRGPRGLLGWRSGCVLAGLV